MQGAIINILKQVCFVNKGAVIPAAADLDEIADRRDDCHKQEQDYGRVHNPDHEAEQLVELVEHRQAHNRREHGLEHPYDDGDADEYDDRRQRG